MRDDELYNMFKANKKKKKTTYHATRTIRLLLMLFFLRIFDKVRYIWYTDLHESHKICCSRVSK